MKTEKQPLTSPVIASEIATGKEASFVGQETIIRVALAAIAIASIVLCALHYKTIASLIIANPIPSFFVSLLVVGTLLSITIYLAAFPKDTPSKEVPPSHLPQKEESFSHLPQMVISSSTQEEGFEGNDVMQIADSSFVSSVCSETDSMDSSKAAATVHEEKPPPKAADYMQFDKAQYNKMVENDEYLNQMHYLSERDKLSLGDFSLMSKSDQKEYQAWYDKNLWKPVWVLYLILKSKKKEDKAYEELFKAINALNEEIYAKNTAFKEALKN